MNNFWNSVILVGVSAVITFLLRAFPFMVFGKKRTMPAGVKKVADFLPPAIMGVLVIYCIKGDLLSIPDGGSVSLVATGISLAAVTGIHLWKRKTLLSIAVGTVLYMLLIRVLPLLNL